MNRTTHRALALLLSLASVVFMSLSLAGPAEAKPRTADVTAVPVSGTADLADGTTGIVTGTFDVERFANQSGTLMAIGEFDGQITDTTGAVVAQDTQTLALPVDLAQSEGSCQILDLVLGPLDLDLLGLEVHLDTVHLNITAQQGPGNLLGNLLCAVAGLLDGPTGLNAILTQIANLLNQILGVLG
jgi:hypothetical protein